MQPASATREVAIPSIGGDELAEGLMLVRASTLKLIRLQLAMERRDRRVALEAVDDLVALDRCLEEFLTQVPNGYESGLLGGVLEMERSALNMEKHTLAAGISMNDREPEAREPEPRAEEVEADDPPMGEWVPYDEGDFGFEPSIRRWPKWIAILLLLVAVGCGAFMLGRMAPDWPQLVEIS